MTQFPGEFWQPALFGVADQPLPSGAMAPGIAPAVLVGVVPPHPSNRVEVVVRDGLKSSRIVPANRRHLAMTTGSRQAGPGQWFSATLPAVRPGQPLEYRVRLMRAGQELAALPRDGSWLSLQPDSGNKATTPRIHKADEPTTAPAPAAPRWAYDLKFFAALTVDLRAEILGATPAGFRINFFVKDGTVRGPGIDAVVLPEGGDWMCIRPDGIGMVDISITYKTADGALILERSGGVFDLGPEGYAIATSGHFAGSPPFYATPAWETAHPAWQWLNRRQGFGIGRVVLDQLQVRCDIYLPTVGDALSGVSLEPT